MILLNFSVTAFGLSMEIRSPQIGCPPNLDEKQNETLGTVIQFMNKKLTLIEGIFVNEYSTQRFGASSEQTLAFIDLLRDAKLWQVQVLFRDFGEQDSAFTLGQSSLHSVTLIINSGREDFRLKDFQSFLKEVKSNPKNKPEAKANTGQTTASPESESEGSDKSQPESKEHSR